MHHRRSCLRAWLALAVLTTVSAAACDRGETPEEPDEVIQASPLTPASPSPGPSPSPTETSTEASPSPTPTGTASPRPATDTDRARFVQSYRPEGASDLEHAAVDLDADGTDELVFAYVGPGDTARVDVAWWDGSQYQVEERTEGGPATTIDRLRVSDVNADGVTEVVTFQSSGSGASLSLWQVTEGRGLRGLRARGGCADGLHTYGVVGAELEDRDGDGAAEIRATCDGSPLPVAAWPTHTYVWADGAYRHRGELDD